MGDFGSRGGGGLFWEWGPRENERPLHGGRKWGGPSCILPLAHLAWRVPLLLHRKCPQRLPVWSTESRAWRREAAGEEGAGTRPLAVLQSRSESSRRVPRG